MKRPGSKALWALGGGLLGGGAVVVYLALRQGDKMAADAAVQVEALAKATAEQYLAQGYGLTADRIRRMGELSETFGG